MLNEKVMEIESYNQKLKDELINLREEMKKGRKVDDHLVSLYENILEEQEQLHDVKVECFTEIQKMEDKIKALEKHLILHLRSIKRWNPCRSKLRSWTNRETWKKMFQVAF